MTDATAYSPFDWLLALAVAAGVQLGSLVLLQSSGGSGKVADISDEMSKPIAVSITPILDDAPLLKLGSKRDPRKLPDRWIAPRAVERQAAAAFPSPAAPTNVEAIPKAPVADAGQKPAPPDAEITKQVDMAVAVPEAGPAPVSTVEGAADGVKEGTETDPLKAHAVNLYRAKLDGWFSSRFAIRGKIPFDALKKLRSSVTVQLTPERTVSGFSINHASGDSVFDAELRSTLEKIQSSGAELPPPPPNYPDVLGTSLPLSFSCTTRSLCE